MQKKVEGGGWNTYTKPGDKEWGYISITRIINQNPNYTDLMEGGNNALIKNLKKILLNKS